MVTWDECHDELKPDGSLRDIYILDAELQTWEDAFLYLASTGGARFSLDGHVAPLPCSASECLKRSVEVAALMVIPHEGIEFACHFFTEAAFELDFVPNEVDGPKAFLSLLSFIRGLGRATRRSVLVTPENGRSCPFLSYDATADDFQFIKPPMRPDNPALQPTGSARG